MAKEEDFFRLIKKATQLVALAFVLVIIADAFLVYYMVDPNMSAFRSPPEKIMSAPLEEDFNRIENGIHVRTGLLDGEGLITVVNNCTSCHSAKIIIQNRMSTTRWNATIKWMQETQNLGDLGENQEVIVNYLVTNYPPKEIGRRENLNNVDWYELNN